MEPNTSFRAIWQYQNLMFMTAGYLEERLTGRSWDDLVKERIFTPLGMTRSLTSIDGMTNADDFAWAYGCRDSAVVRIPYRNIDQVGPAGSINSSVEDMLKYVQFRIDLGEAGGRQLLSKTEALEMQKPQMVIGGAADALWGGFDMIDYGLGVATGVYRGHHAVIHGGGIDGFISQMSWLPDDHIGLVVLSNQGTNNPIPTLIAKALYDRVLGLPPIDWAAPGARDGSGQRSRPPPAGQARGRSEARHLAQPSTGRLRRLLRNPGYGTLVIRTAGNALELVLDDMRAPLSHYHYDTFRVVARPDAGMLQGLVSFQTGANGEIDRVLIPLEPTMARPSS